MKMTHERALELQTMAYYRAIDILKEGLKRKITLFDNNIHLNKEELQFIANCKFTVKQV